MNFTDSQTYKNLQTAFEGESKACAKYLIFELKAREDGYEQIGNIFHETSMNEREHAEIWYKWLHGGEVPDTLDNLINAAAGEQYEWQTMYRDFAQTARCEGYDDLAELFMRVGNIEKNHDARYRKLIYNIRQEEVFCKPGEVVWICMVCGNVTHGTCAPEVCPVCGHTKSFAEIKATNY